MAEGAIVAVESLQPHFLTRNDLDRSMRRTRRLSFGQKKRHVDRIDHHNESRNLFLHPRACGDKENVRAPYRSSEDTSLNIIASPDVGDYNVHD